MPTRKKITKPKLKKKTQKRIAPKEVIHSSSKPKLVTATGKECFWIHGGPVVANLRELLRAFENEISDKQYMHHISDGYSDFSKWIREVLKNNECARALLRVKRRATAVARLKECLRAYRK